MQKHEKLTPVIKYILAKGKANGATFVYISNVLNERGMPYPLVAARKFFQNFETENKEQIQALKEQAYNQLANTKAFIDFGW